MLSSSRVMPCRASFNVCPAMMRAFSSSSFPSFCQVDQIGATIFFVGNTYYKMLPFHIVYETQVMLGLSLKVALHNSCCVTQIFLKMTRSTARD